MPSLNPFNAFQETEAIETEPQLQLFFCLYCYASRYWLKIKYTIAAKLFHNGRFKSLFNITYKSLACNLQSTVAIRLRSFDSCSVERRPTLTHIYILLSPEKRYVCCCL